MLAALLAPLMHLSLGLSIWASPTDEVREQVRRIVNDERLQTELGDPVERAEQAPERPRRDWTWPNSSDTSQPSDGPRDPRPLPREPETSPDGGARDGAGVPWTRVLLWLVAALLGAWLLAFATRLWRAAPSAEAGRAALATSASGAGGVGASLPRAPYDEAEVLAASGRFAEAVHVLLLRALSLLAGKGGAPLHASETSREVLARLRLTAPARQALAFLVSAVEISRFGGRALNADAWAQARTAWNAGSPGGSAT